MKSKTLLAVAGTAVIVGAAWYISHLRAPETNVGTPPLYPDLIARVNDIKRVEIESPLTKTVLSGEGNVWRIENRDGYPARFEDVKPMILAIGELRIIEPKTRLPEMYPHIGVEDVSAEKSTSTQITLKDAAGTSIAALIIGKERAAGSGPIKSARYVRKGGDPQSYLVEGALNVSADPLSWTDRQLLSIPAARIREVSILRPGEPAVEIRREKPEDIDLTLRDIPPGFKAKAAATVTSLASALEELRFDDVRARTSVNWPADATVTTLRGFDGLVATVKSATIDNRQYAQLEFAFDPAGVTVDAETQSNSKPEGAPDLPVPGAEANTDAPEQEMKLSVAEEVKALNQRVQNWVYVLPEYKQSMLTMTLDNLIAKQEAAKPAEPLPPPPDPLKVERFDEQGKALPPTADDLTAPVIPTEPATESPAQQDEPAGATEGAPTSSAEDAEEPSAAPAEAASSSTGTAAPDGESAPSQPTGSTVQAAP
jgi:hypothetical protein